MKRIAAIAALAMAESLMSRDVIGRPMPTYERRYFRDPRLAEEARGRAEAKRQRKAAKRVAEQQRRK